jgi:ribosomal-protein-alanine N-acetyltransferase
MEATFKAMTVAAAREILSWEYGPPYDFYNMPAAGERRVVDSFLDPANRCFRIEGAQGALVGFCCFGPDARVPGGDYGADQLDVGLGLRPDMTGRSLGPGIIARVCEFARARFGPSDLRVSIAAFNRRAIRACGKAGFELRGAFERSTDGEPFVQLSLIVDQG